MAYKCGIQHAEEEKTEGFLKKKKKRKITAILLLRSTNARYELLLTEFKLDNITMKKGGGIVYWRGRAEKCIALF